VIEVWAAAMLGVAGSLHCVGMCGPIALALPRPSGSTRSLLTGRLLYNLGRAVTYAAMGAVFGLLGQSLLLAGWQRGLSITAGVLILAYVLSSWLGRGRWSLESAALRFIAPVQRTLGRLLKRTTTGGLLVVGLLNGLLPCGLVYVALAGAAATGSAWGGAGFMFIFGLGTLPMMLAISLVGPSLYGRFRGRFQRVIPLALGVMAVLFILRGLELGIPYVSPNLAAQVEDGALPACCRH
jgi:sulfite exporter TauE/SafE